MRILVVDDSEDSRDVVEAALFSGGYSDIVTAASGWEAIKLLDIGGRTDGAPAADIILLDIMMPEIDGIETCARIRNDGRYIDVPIIMVTSLDDMDSLANAFVAGANDYVNKPLNRIELIARVRSALKLKAELERRQERERELLRFLSHWGDKHASVWIDDATGFFIGEVAEAYLTAQTVRHPHETTSVIALSVDRLDVVQSAMGADIARRILGQVADSVRSVAAVVGAVPASYRNGLITVIAPDADTGEAGQLAEALRKAVARLAIANSESIAADHVTASVAVATGKISSGAERVNLLTRAISGAQSAAAAGGNKVVVIAA